MLADGIYRKKMLSTRLNVDVLTMIVSEFLNDDSDVLSFTLVCSALRPVANKRLLSMRSISLRRDVCWNTDFGQASACLPAIPEVRYNA